MFSDTLNHNMNLHTNVSGRGYVFYLPILLKFIAALFSDGPSSIYKLDAAVHVVRDAR